MAVHSVGDNNLFRSHLELLVFLGRVKSSFNEED